MTIEKKSSPDTDGTIVHPDVTLSAQGATQNPSLDKKSTSGGENTSDTPLAASSKAQRAIDPQPRKKRYLDFAEFANVAPQLFAELRDADENAREFHNHYTLYAIKNGRWGGTNKRAFDVFFGNRPFDVVRHGASGQELRTLTEQGASLSYYQDDRGRVHCFLRPASSEGMLPIENSIRLKTIMEPRALLEGRLIEKHFRILIAYMQCTSLDGYPSLGARLKIGWLRFTHPLAIDDRWRPTVFSVGLRELGKYVATIGLSGFLLFTLQAWLSSKDSDPRTVFIGGETTEMRVARAQALEAGEQQKEALVQLNQSVQRFAKFLDKGEAKPPRKKGNP